MRKSTDAAGKSGKSYGTSVTASGKRIKGSPKSGTSSLNTTGHIMHTRSGKLASGKKYSVQVTRVKPIPGGRGNYGAENYPRTVNSRIETKGGKMVTRNRTLNHPHVKPGDKRIEDRGSKFKPHHRTKV